MMEQGIIPRNERLLDKYYSAKRNAKQMFIQSMKDVDGFNQ